MNALRNLGPIEAARCVASYLWVRIHPPKDKTTLEGFVASVRLAPVPALLQDAEREGVGRPVHGEIQADWGAQRIKNLSLLRRVGSPQAQANPAQEGQVEAGDEPDRGVQLPKYGGDDVGARH